MHDYMEQYGDKLEVIGNVYDNARIGLVAVSYTHLTAVLPRSAGQRMYRYGS